jgi:hypothetical protein
VIDVQDLASVRDWPRENQVFGERHNGPKAEVSQPWIFLRAWSSKAWAISEKLESFFSRFQNF